MVKKNYSIVDGRTEAVMWILTKYDKFLVEDRPIYEQGESRCIPCGHINLDLDKGDYIESAFLRESKEEFKSGNFVPLKYHFLKTIDFDETNHKGGIDKYKLHYFVVTNWDGVVPEYTVEDGKKHSDLNWILISSYKSLPQTCDREAIEELIKEK